MIDGDSHGSNEGVRRRECEIGNHPLRHVCNGREVCVGLMLVFFFFFSSSGVLVSHRSSRSGERSSVGAATARKKTCKRGFLLSSL